MKTLDNKSAKQRVTSLRKALGWSQTDLAEKCGMSRASYNTAEGMNNLNIFFRPEQLVNLKYALKTSYEYILEGKQSDVPLLQINNSNELEKEILILKEKIQSQADLIQVLKENVQLLKKSK